MDFKDLQNANNYNEWLDIAYKIDKEAGKIQWREDEESELFHSKLMREHISRFKDLINQKKAKELIYLVQESLSRHFSELNNLELYSYALSGTKFIISEYFQLIEESINFITDNKIEGISRNEKIRILSEGNRVHGNTA
ncbi:MAG: DUF3336 domain-containing protein, partial [Leptospiraceae bacterium]|nr:DUF3336 domain-containing protein [Leptospiraceae bacterium]